MNGLVKTKLNSKSSPLRVLGLLPYLKGQYRVREGGGEARRSRRTKRKRRRERMGRREMKVDKNRKGVRRRRRTRRRARRGNRMKGSRSWKR